MKSDNNPSMLFGLYSKPNKKLELLEELNNLGVGVREISFIDVEIPPERKDEIINFFKHFVLCDYWAERTPKLKLFGIDFKEKLFKKVGYKPVNINRGDWKNDNRHKLIWTLAVPLAYQDTSMHATTEEERQAINDLATFSSKDYKENIVGVVEDNQMKFLKKGSKKHVL